jgi:hypothetical protein
VKTSYYIFCAVCILVCVGSLLWSRHEDSAYDYCYATPLRDKQPRCYDTERQCNKYLKNIRNAAFNLGETKLFENTKCYAVGAR